MTDDRRDFDEFEEEFGEGEFPPAVPAPRADRDLPPDPPTEGEDEGYVDPPTEELFAFEARVEDGDVPDLDPVFRAALLESSESALDDGGDPIDDSEATASTPPARPAPEQPAPEPPTGTGEPAIPGTGEFDSTGEYPLTGEEPATGTHEWEPETDTGMTAEQTAVLQATARNEVHEAIEFSRRTGRSWDPPRPPRSGDFDRPAKRPHYWWRFLLAVVLVIGSFATATQASVMNVVNGITEDIGQGKNEIKLPGWLINDADGPQTVLIIGSDVRTGGGAATDDPGRSDTAMLVRLDPDTNQIAMLSIPRDLYVNIPGVGYDKFNAAYSYGGTKLTVQTIKELTGLDINLVVNVDFQGFADVIDAIGCVYVDIDRHYFNDNAGLSVSEQYATIDIPAGYQKLCGTEALEFARYRHTDSDLVRAARQQDLIGEVRNRLTFGEIIKRRDELLKAFTDNTSSTITDSKQIFQLLALLFDSRGAAVTEVSFPSSFTMRNDISYVEASPEEIKTAVNRFLGFEDESGPVGTLNQGDGANSKPRNNTDKAEERKAARQRQKQLKQSTSSIPTKENDGLTDMSSTGLSEAMNLAGQITRTDFPVFYTKRLPEGAIYESDQNRVYHLRDPDKNVYGAYRMVMSVLKDDGTHYFGLQGIHGWTDPPILEAPHEEIEMDGRKFQVYPEGDRIRLVSWTDDDNVYWISNSLLLALDNEQMLGMARATRAYTPDK